MKKAQAINKARKLSRELQDCYYVVKDDSYGHFGPDAFAIATDLDLENFFQGSHIITAFECGQEI